MSAPATPVHATPAVRLPATTSNTVAGAAAVRAATAAAPAPFSTPALLVAMLKTSAKVSDLFFSLELVDLKREKADSLLEASAT